MACLYFSAVCEMLQCSSGQKAGGHETRHNPCPPPGHLCMKRAGLGLGTSPRTAEEVLTLLGDSRVPQQTELSAGVFSQP